MASKRFTPVKRVRPDLTPIEAEATLAACDLYLENARDFGVREASVERAMRKIGIALVRAGGAKVRKIVGES